MWLTIYYLYAFAIFALCSRYVYIFVLLRIIIISVTAVSSFNWFILFLYIYIIIGSFIADLHRKKTHNIYVRYRIRMEKKFIFTRERGTTVDRKILYYAYKKNVNLYLMDKIGIRYFNKKCVLNNVWTCKIHHHISVVYFLIPVYYI